jgi:hypothetical protein
VFCGRDPKFAAFVFVQSMGGRRTRKRAASTALHFCEDCETVLLASVALQQRLTSVLARIRNASGDGSAANSLPATCPGEFTTGDATDTAEPSPESFGLASSMLSRAGVKLPTCCGAERGARSGAESDGAV